jgi:hypothetical protein
MARSRIEVQIIDAFELGNLALRLRTKRRPALKSMQYDSFEQIPERHVAVLGERLQYLKQAPFHAYPRLDTFDEQMLRCFRQETPAIETAFYLGTLVPRKRRLP